MSLSDFDSCLLIKIASAADTDSLYENLLILSHDGKAALLTKILIFTDYHPAPLLWSVMHSFHALTLLLLNTGGININAQTFEGLTALHIAVIYGDDAIVELLLEQKGINVEVMDYWGRTPLYCALEDQQRRAATMLVEAGAAR